MKKDLISCDESDKCKWVKDERTQAQQELIDDYCKFVKNKSFGCSERYCKHCWIMEFKKQRGLK